MCLGSLLLPRLPMKGRNSWRVYAAIELGIGALGILVLFFMPLAGSVYTAWSGSGFRGFLFRGAVAATCLLPPTLLMGATLPALARAAGSAVTWLGGIYAGNIAGAVFGCLLSGFYLLRQYDVATATYVAVAINLTIAAGAFVVGSARQGRSLTVAVQNAGTVQGPPGGVCLAIGLSGLCALGAEAIWTRTLGLLFGGSVYTFSIILAVFLVGLGAGSGVGSLMCRSPSRARLALAWCQLLAAGAMTWASYTMVASLPYWPINPSISSNIWFSFQLDLARAAWAVLPPTLLWGASFPLALAAASQERDSSTDGGRLMARIYAANTLGAIVGIIGASLLLVAWIGSLRAEQVLVALSVMSGMLLLRRRWAALLLAGLAAAVLVRAIPPISKLLVAYGRYAATWVGKSDVIYAAEGMNSSLAVASFPSGALTFHVAGKIQASNVPRDMRLQRMLGHLTTLTVAHPRSVLVIGCGAGITAGAVSIDPRVERVTIAEIESLVPKAASAYFSGPNFDVLHNSKVQVRIDDGRHYLLTSMEKFDGITVDPLDPWVKGASNLYTKEFFETVKRHLNPGGSITMYIQLFETDLEAVKSAVATFFDAFPNGTIWGNPYDGKGHDMVLLGQAEPLRIDLDEMEHRFGYRDADNKVPESLSEVGMNSPVDLFATYAGRKSDLIEWLKGAAINRDRNLRMQYLAGLGLDRNDADAIYAGILAYRHFPDDIFVSEEGRVDSLKRAIQRGTGAP
jgi:spermidine synthase